MPVVFNQFVGGDAGLAGPAGPVIDVARLKYLIAEVTLVAGTANQVLTDEQAAGIPDGWPGLIPVLKNAGGGVGWLRAVYVAATKTLTVTSTSATDTSTVNLFVLLPL